MRIDVTNQKITKDGKPLEGVTWFDVEAGEACIFCYDHLNRKIPTDTDPSGYETLIVRGTISAQEAFLSQPQTEAHMSFDWGTPGYPNCLQVENPEPSDSDYESFTKLPQHESGIGLVPSIFQFDVSALPQQNKL